MYRHFIAYIIHISIKQYSHAKLQGLRVTFRKFVEELLANLKIATTPIVGSMNTEKVCSDVNTATINSIKTTVTPQQNHVYESATAELFDEITKIRPNPYGRKDKTVFVRQLYCLLEKADLLKDSSEKMLFL